ncbi:MAG: hypothetical protein WAZ30_13800 [Syntrophorhabdus sp.]
MNVRWYDRVCNNYNPEGHEYPCSLDHAIGLQCNIMVIRKKPWDNTKNGYVYLKKIKDCAIA